MKKQKNLIYTIMKTPTSIKALLLGLLLIVPFMTLADGNDTIPPTEPNPFDDKIEIPLKKIRWQRSLFDPINAYYYIGEYAIEMEFNENVGIVNISVTNTDGVAIYNITHDTSIESGCTILLPSNNDYYNIYISGSKYEAYASILI